MNFFETNKEKIDKFFDGTGADSYSFFGAHKTENGIEFAVFAPNAKAVSVVGDFNDWDDSKHILTLERGIWYGVIKEAKSGDSYKYAINTGENVILKSDPYAFYSELRPETASIVWCGEDFKWTDKEYTETRKKIDFANSPVNIYEVHLGSFLKKENGDFYNFKEIAPIITNYALKMRYNYIELMPVCEHPLDDSWGYQTTGYYSVTSRYGTPDDFKFFVNFLHNAGIGVIIDWVPGHFCRDSHGLYQFDGKPLYESDNVKKADNPGWGTCNFDFSRTYVKSFLKSNADYWITEFHVDGIRADAVANMMTYDFGKQQCNELKNKYGTFENIEGICFLRELNDYVSKKYPEVIMCAEDSSDRPGITSPTEIGGLGFTFKWNMGWMNDTTNYMKHDPIYRKSLHDTMSFCMLYAFGERYILPLSHDEVVHGKCSMLEKMPGYRVDKFAQLRAYYTYMYGLPGKKLQFMGNEFGQSLEWRFYEQLEWNLLELKECATLKDFCGDLNYLYLNEQAFWKKDTTWEGFKWCNAGDADRSVYSFVRFGEKDEDTLVFIMNFTPMHYEKYEMGVPNFTEYKEILNSDDAIYGGNNIKNRGILVPKLKVTGEMPYTLTLDLAPFGAIILKGIKGIKEI